ncbi:MAG: hypothetical protein Ct9H300mP30_3880 [Methanobacteriota archaeon]|nr:MAG: hypothetical protein Ct9H300mP30_3880 [Euryarchaeota archaeon]
MRSRRPTRLADKYPSTSGSRFDRDAVQLGPRPFVYGMTRTKERQGLRTGHSCYGSGSTEYHTYLDTMDRFNEESLMVPESSTARSEVPRLRRGQ